MITLQIAWCKEFHLLWRQHRHILDMPNANLASLGPKRLMGAARAHQKCHNVLFSYTVARSTDVPITQQFWHAQISLEDPRHRGFLEFLAWWQNLLQWTWWFGEVFKISGSLDHIAYTEWDAHSLLYRQSGLQHAHYYLKHSIRAVQLSPLALHCMRTSARSI
jgi:hypothetical protein